MSRETDIAILMKMLLSPDYTEKDCQRFAEETDLDIAAIITKMGDVWQYA